MEKEKKIPKWSIAIIIAMLFIDPRFIFAVGIPIGLIIINFAAMSQTKQWLNSPKVWVTVKSIKPLSEMDNEEEIIDNLHEVIYEYYDRLGNIKEYEDVTEKQLYEGQQIEMILWTKKDGKEMLISRSDIESNLNSKGEAGHNWIVIGFAIMFAVIGWASILLG